MCDTLVKAFAARCPPSGVPGPLSPTWQNCLERLDLDPLSSPLPFREQNTNPLVLVILALCICYFFNPLGGWVWLCGLSLEGVVGQRALPALHLV